MRLILLLISMIFITSCGTKSKEDKVSGAEKKEQAELMEEVMAIHDEVMPMMGKMNKFRKEAQSRADALLQDSSVVNDQEAMELENLAIELDAVSESMMSWMRSFDNDFDSLEHKEIMEYLHQEKERISEVNTDIKDVLSRSEQLLSDNE
jgi:hypothetical protein